MTKHSIPQPTPHLEHQNKDRFVVEQHGAAGIARRAHKMVTLRSLDRNEVLLLFSPKIFTLFILSFL